MLARRARPAWVPGTSAAENRLVVVLQAFPSPINFRAVADVNHQDAYSFRLEAVYDAIVAHSHPVQTNFLASHCNRIGRKRVLGQRPDSIPQSVLYWRSQRQEFPPR